MLNIRTSFRRGLLRLETLGLGLGFGWLATASTRYRDKYRRCACMHDEVEWKDKGTYIARSANDRSSWGADIVDSRICLELL